MRHPFHYGPHAESSHDQQIPKAAELSSLADAVDWPAACSFLWRTTQTHKILKLPSECYLYIQSLSWSAKDFFCDSWFWSACSYAVASSTLHLLEGGLLNFIDILFLTSKFWDSTSNWSAQFYSLICTSNPLAVVLCVFKWHLFCRNLRCCLCITVIFVNALYAVAPRIY